ncbi:DUF5131 family protein [Sporomusa malonica]|uniref:Protein gp37 n=2 Tax=Sporomusa malonica TaxID=112901 RepID=A0A1W2ATR1_9FIRM|nr:phage Gp37/Gp68 family protein [Sporomusa malonica]SMC64085.1 protein gp37 [Sporomusa malonica]
MSKSKIEWTDKVWNPVTGCSKISPGCDNCYAERMSKRFAETWGLSADNYFDVKFHPDRLLDPIKWRKPSKIFVCSMADLFHDKVLFKQIADVFKIMADCPQHTFLLLTKRPDSMKDFFDYVKPVGRDWPLPNVWLGVTAENQEQADKRIPILLQIPAAVRFVSVEPMLGPVDLQYYFDDYAMNELIHRSVTLDWVICGGESGPKARPMHPEWARSLRDQCQSAGVPYFFKQWGEWRPLEGTGACHPTPVKFWFDEWGKWTDGISGMGQHVVRIGKKAAGSLLDGQEWKQFPGEAV